MNERGHTLLEMVIVVAILAVMAAIAVPNSRPARQEKLLLAAGLAADAFRFARDEAARTGDVYGVSVDTAGDRLQVFRLDVLPNPNVPEFDVRHPVSKQFYTVAAGLGSLSGVSVESQSGTLTGPCTLPEYIGFDPTGATVCIEPLSTRVENASLTLVYDGVPATISVDSYTGRTIVQ